MENVEMDRG